MPSTVNNHKQPSISPNWLWLNICRRCWGTSFAGSCDCHFKPEVQHGATKHEFQHPFCACNNQDKQFHTPHSYASGFQKQMRSQHVLPCVCVRSATEPQFTHLGVMIGSLLLPLHEYRTDNDQLTIELVSSVMLWAEDREPNPVRLAVTLEMATTRRECCNRQPRWLRRFLVQTWDLELLNDGHLRDTF